MTANDRDALRKLEDEQLLALIIYGEARGESREGQEAVGAVVINRAGYGKTHPNWGDLYGDTIFGVCTAKYQFSCLNDGDPNKERLIWIAEHWDTAVSKYDVLDECLEIAQGLLDGTIRRPVNALYYHTKQSKPAWRLKLTVEKTIGNHVFYV